MNSLVPAKHLVDDNSIEVAGKRRLREIRLILSQDMSLVHLFINVCVRIDMPHVKQLALLGKESLGYLLSYVIRFNWL